MVHLSWHTYNCLIDTLERAWCAALRDADMRCVVRWGPLWLSNRPGQSLDLKNKKNAWRVEKLALRVPPESVIKSFLLCQPLPGNAAAETALQPLIWSSDGPFPQISSSPEECFFHRNRHILGRTEEDLLLLARAEGILLGLERLRAAPQVLGAHRGT